MPFHRCKSRGVNLTRGAAELPVQKVQQSWQENSVGWIESPHLPSLPIRKTLVQQVWLDVALFSFFRKRTFGLLPSTGPWTGYPQWYRSALREFPQMFRCHEVGLVDCFVLLFPSWDFFQKFWVRGFKWRLSHCGWLDHQPCPGLLEIALEGASLRGILLFCLSTFSGAFSKDLN